MTACLWWRVLYTHSCVGAFAHDVRLQRHLVLAATGDGLGGRRLGLVGQLVEAAADVDAVCRQEAVADKEQGEDRQPEAGGASSADRSGHFGGGGAARTMVQRQTSLLIHDEKKRIWGLEAAMGQCAAIR